MKKTTPTSKIKPPVSYYGGKQTMLRHILPLIPKHTLYAEVFCGGAALFWAKEPSSIEVINDINGEVSNFYRVLKRYPKELEMMVNETMHSRKSYEDAIVIYNNPHLFTEVKRAWAFWVACNQSYTSKIGAGWGYERKDKNRCAITVDEKRKRFTEYYAERLSRVSVECRDARKIIKSRDTIDSFFYCDPPYPDTHQGHYSGYSVADFISLLNVLKGIEGKFLLSSYPLPELTEYCKENGWHQLEFDKTISAANHKKRKTEVLTTNYSLN